MTSATVSHYPRVSEWLYIGDTAINMAQVTAVEFGDGYAIVRLTSYRAEDDVLELGKTWFKIKDAGIVRLLRAYVEQMSAPGVEPASPGYRALASTPRNG